jgi:preprotein translocase subunit SecE
VARRKRRDDDAVDKRLDQGTDGTPDEAAEDLSEDALDADDLEPSDLEDPEPDGKSGRIGTAVKRAKTDPDSDTRSKSKTKPDKGKAEKPETARRVGPIGRLTRFIREVFAELRKVIWPTRKELLTYTVVVVFFVAVMLAIIGLLDVAFARAMLWVFGSNTAEQ